MNCKTIPVTVRKDELRELKLKSAADTVVMQVGALIIVMVGLLLMLHHAGW